MSDYTLAELAESVSLDFSSVDRDKNIIYGVIIAEKGVFRSRRGAFDQAALQTITSLVNKDKHGKTVYLGHPKGGNDVERPYLGVVRNARMEGDTRVRADLHIADLAMKPMVQGGTPPGEHVMDIAEADKRVLEMSPRIHFRKKKKTMDRVQIWEVGQLDGVDVVRMGDSTKHGLLDAGDPNNGNVDQPGELTVPEEDGTLPLEETQIRNLVADEVSKAFGKLTGEIKETVSASLNAIEEKRDQERKDQENKDKLQKAELSDKSNKFLLRAIDVPALKKDDAKKMAEEIQKGDLSYESALEKLTDAKLSAPGSEMDNGDGEGQHGELSLDQKVEKQLKKEFDADQKAYMGYGLSFEDYKAEQTDRVRAELSAA